MGAMWDPTLGKGRISPFFFLVFKIADRRVLSEAFAPLEAGTRFALTI